MTQEAGAKGSGTNDMIEDIKDLLGVLEDDDILSEIRRLLDIEYRYQEYE